MSTASQLTNDIIARHELFGELCLEATLSYENKNYTAALACLFVLTETSLKFAIEDDPEDKWGLDMSISEAKKKDFITKEQVKELRFLQLVRNTLFHQDSYSSVIEHEGTAFPLADPDTKKLLYETLWEQVFLIAKQIVTR
jgi:hypothetical protein